MSETALAKRSEEQRRIERALGRLDRLSKLMDDQFELPIVKVRVGLDPIIGLIPGGGDWVSWTVSLYILFEAIRLQVPAKVMLGIGWNATSDLVLGYAPGVGDFIDILYKANRRSVKLILDWFEAQKNPTTPDIIHVPQTALEKPKSGPERWLIGAVLVLVLTAVAALPFAALWWVFGPEG